VECAYRFIMPVVAALALASCGNDRALHLASGDGGLAGAAGLEGTWNGNCELAGVSGSRREIYTFGGQLGGVHYRRLTRNYETKECTGSPVTVKVEGEFRLGAVRTDGTAEIDLVLGPPPANATAYTIYLIEGDALLFGDKPGSKSTERPGSVDRNKPYTKLERRYAAHAPLPSPLPSPTPSATP